MMRICNCKGSCTLLAVIASVIIGVVAAFLQVTGVITVAPVFLWVALGVAVVYLGVLVLATALAGEAGGCGSICTVLSIIAVKMKKKSAMVLFILAFAASMGMGAMSGQDVTQAWVNWVEQGINCAGQGMLMWGVLILHKAGLKDFQI